MPLARAATDAGASRPPPPTIVESIPVPALLPPGKVDVVANYTAFERLLNRLAVEST